MQEIGGTRTENSACLQCWIESGVESPAFLPAPTSEWESVNVHGLCFAGVLMYMRDFKKKQSEFIHGFCYNIKTYSLFELKY